jgi:hypothetical protein
MSDSDGKVDMVLGVHEGKVLMRFKEPMQEILFDHDNAINVSMALADLAFECRDDVKPASSALKAELVDRHRMTLVNRLAVVFNGQREDKKLSNGQLAQKVTDIMLAEVFK